jgi:hypothetical protein
MDYRNYKITFSGCQRSSRYPYALSTKEQIVGKVRDRYRVMVVEARRYVLFVGESDPAVGDEAPENPIPNKLTEADDGQVRVFGGVEYMVIGYGGEARFVRKGKDLGRPGAN